MTHYAKLGYMEKEANKARAAAGLGLDVGMGWNPVTGVPYFGAKAVNDFSKGRIGSGLGNILFGGLSFLPGGGSAGAAVKGGFKGIMAGLKGVRGAKQVSRLGGGRASQAVKNVGSAVKQPAAKPYMATGAAGLGLSNPTAPPRLRGMGA